MIIKISSFTKTTGYIIFHWHKHTHTHTPIGLDTTEDILLASDWQSSEKFLYCIADYKDKITNSAIKIVATDWYLLLSITTRLQSKSWGGWKHCQFCKPKAK